MEPTSSDMNSGPKIQEEEEEVPVVSSTENETPDSTVQEQDCYQESDAFPTSSEAETKTIDTDDKTDTEDCNGIDGIEGIEKTNDSPIGIKSRLRIRKETSIDDNLHKIVKTTTFKKNNVRAKGLETIFEEPLEKKGKVYLTSASKSIRSLNINDGETIPAKKKKIRKLKAKTVRTLFKRKKK